MTQRHFRLPVKEFHLRPKANQDLVYYYINHSCVFGVKKYQGIGQGKRPKQMSVQIHLCNLYSYKCFYSTIKQECKVIIRLSLSDDGQHLVVTGINENYTLDVSKVRSSHYLNHYDRWIK